MPKDAKSKWQSTETQKTNRILVFGPTVTIEEDSSIKVSTDKAYLDQCENPAEVKFPSSVMNYLQ